MIEPPPKGEAYPGLLPPVHVQWGQLTRNVRAALVGVPLILAGILFAANLTLGVVAAVMAVGVGTASAVYIKNRTDRHNAAVERGEIRVVEDPHLQPRAVDDLDPELAVRLQLLGYPTDALGEVSRFDGGWIVKRRTRVELAVVVGDDGGHAYFDGRAVSDLRAATEYRAGRGREATTS